MITRRCGSGSAKRDAPVPGALLVRRSLGQEPDLKYHRSSAPAEVPLKKVAEVRATRWTIEEDIQSGKGECGLDEYETRGWLGWHHHTALSMLALTFLVLQRARLGEKRATDDRTRGASSPRPPCQTFASGTWTKSTGPTGGGSGNRNKAAAAHRKRASPNCDAACEVGRESLRCSTKYRQAVLSVTSPTPGLRSSHS